jgi:hypothetical protein
MNGYIDKPVNPESLFEALSQWLTKANRGGRNNPVLPMRTEAGP